MLGHCEHCKRRDVLICALCITIASHIWPIQLYWKCVNSVCVEDQGGNNGSVLTKSNGVVKNWNVKCDILSYL